MTTILELILLTSIIVLGITISTQSGMILYSFREWADKKQEEGKKWVVPLIVCIWCMPSLWSLVGYLFAALTGVIDHFSWHLVFMYPVVVCGSSFLSGVAWMLYTKIEIQIKYYENEEQNSHFNLKDRKERFKREKSNHH